MSMIRRNMARCLTCGDTIESKHVHDFVNCRCGDTSVDGGLDYLRRLYTEEPGYEELSEYYTPHEVAEQLRFIYRGRLPDRAELNHWLWGAADTIEELLDESSDKKDPTLGEEEAGRTSGGVAAPNEDEPQGEAAGAGAGGSAEALERAH